MTKNTQEKNSANKHIKLATWNVNGIRASYDKGLSHFVETQSPDILCLQETKAHIEQTEPYIQSLGYKNYTWSSAHRKGYSGVATFSKIKPMDVLKGIGQPEYDQEGRVVWSQYLEFDLYNIYFPNGGSGIERHNYKQKFLKVLREHLDFEIKRGRDIILVGDYNVAHESQDVYSPAGLSMISGFLPEERQWFSDFLKSGFIDTYRHFYPQQTNVYSWWSYKDQARIKNNGWRIDYICITPNLLKNLKSCEVLMNQEGSDHCPVVAEFEF